MDKYTKEPIDWDSYKEHIWVWYMVDNKSLSDILEILKQDGVVATKQQLEFRLKKWRVFKTIKTQEARWMAKQLDISSSAGEPIVFVKSGKILPESQVAQAVKRHASLPSLAQKFNPGELYTFVVALASKVLDLSPLISATDSDASHSLNTTDLIVCSPGPAASYAREVEPWGFYSTLPWIQFRRAQLDGSFQIQVRSNSRSTMPRRKILPMTFASTSSSNSGLEVCKFATNLGQTMPEVYIGEHIRRICAIAQAQTSLTIDLLEIMIFQLSNNFLGNNGDFNYKHIVHLMGAFGLDNSTTIRFLFEAAADQPTILAVLDKFWKAAYKTSSTKIVSIMFTEYVRRYDGSDEFVLGIYSVLTRAINTENLDLAKVILSGPKSTHVTEALSAVGPDLLARCSGARNHEFALEMAALIMERHDQLPGIINGTRECQLRDDRGPSTIILVALNSGNIRLVRFCFEAGINLLYYCHDGRLPPVPRSAIYSTYRFDGRSIIRHQTTFTAAVIPRVLLNDAKRILSWDGTKTGCFANRAEAERMALQTYSGLSEMLSEIGKLPDWLEGGSKSTQSPDLDVVVLVALYGYDALLQTFKHSPGSLNRGNSEGIWPLSSAALGNNASTCRLLVRLGADPNYLPSFGNWPTPLHHAVYNNSTHLVEVLLELGAEINHRSSIKHNGHDHILGSIEYGGGISALALAMGLRHRETASLLVHRGAEIDLLAFDLAVKSGEPSLIDLLSNAKFSECLIGSCIVENNDDSVLSIVPGSSGVENCDKPSRLQGQQIMYDILSQAASAGNLSLVSRILRMRPSGSDQHSLQDALTCSVGRGFEEISRELIQAGAKLSQYDLAMSFRSCTLASIREFITISPDPAFCTAERSLQESTLEFALLDNTPDVVQFALETFPQAYNSRALSAAVLRAAESGFRGSQEPMHELLLRRSNTDSKQLDPILENTALAIAILFKAPAVVIESLLQRPWPEMQAMYPKCYGVYRTTVEIAGYHEMLVQVFLAQRNPHNVSCVKDMKSRVVHLLPLYLAMDLCDDQVCSKLMARGFLADGDTIVTAIDQHASLDVLDGLLKSCKEGHDIIRLRDELLLRALECKNDHAMRYLIRHGASMSAKSHDSFEGLWGRSTVLQIAVQECRSTDDRRFVQLLLDAGADINEAPAYRGGFTALQAAAMNGQLDLARQLVSLGADINARRAPYEGWTCLEAAARFGKLDMTQFLLDAGAKTTGKEQLQYIRAVKLAQKYGHAAVSQILRKHRPWDESDESLFQEEGIMSFLLLHPIEYTVEEIRDLADKICAKGHARRKYIWPEIDDRSEADETDLSDDGADDHHSLDVNEVVPPSEDPIVASTSQLAFDVLDDRSPGTYGSLTDPFSSQMVVSNPASDYSMPLHSSFAQLQGDPDFHERIFEMEDD